MASCPHSGTEYQVFCPHSGTKQTNQRLRQTDWHLTATSSSTSIAGPTGIGYFPDALPLIRLEQDSSQQHAGCTTPGSPTGIIMETQASCSHSSIENPASCPFGGIEQQASCPHNGSAHQASSPLSGSEHSPSTLHRRSAITSLIPSSRYEHQVSWRYVKSTYHRRAALRTHNVIVSFHHLHTPSTVTFPLAPATVQPGTAKNWSQTVPSQKASQSQAECQGPTVDVDLPLAASNRTARYQQELVKD